jgi:hypothetical protein
VKNKTKKEVEYEMVKVNRIISFLKSIGGIEITPKKNYKHPENVY